MHQPAKAQLFDEKALIVLIRCKANCIVLRKERLDQHAARRVATTGASCSLSQELKSTFRSTKVRETESKVCGNDAHKRYSGEVVTFGDELSAYENINLTLLEIRKYLAEVPAPAR